MTTTATTPESTTVDTTLTAIDQLIAADTPAEGCQQCGASLAESVSDDFCTEDCQQAWRIEHAKPQETEVCGAIGDQAAPESAPVRPLAWLGNPPPGEWAGHAALDAVVTFLSRFSAFPSEHCAPTLALWYAHTHIADRFYVTPRLILDSAEPGSGKTRVLEVAQYLVAAPEMTISATTAALFRLVSQGPVTILFDEVDAIFNPKNGGNNEDLRGLLNAGYKRGAHVARCVGDAKNMQVQRFPVFAPCALAGIAGHMPATITTRAITIHMRRRRVDEPVEAFRERTAERQAQPVREVLRTWLGSVADQVADSVPDMPEGVADRAAEIWEPLLAIADAAGGHWPETARAACRYFVLSTGPQVTSLGVRLLADLREVFTRAGIDRLSTKELLTTLVNAEGSSWADVNGRPLDARRLSSELGRYGVKPVAFDGPDGKAKGYVTYETKGKQEQNGLADAWARYLPVATEESGQQGEGDE